MPTKTKKIKIGDREFIARFIQRPFREGLEVEVDVDGRTIRVGELGLGEEALINKVRAEIEKTLKCSG